MPVEKFSKDKDKDKGSLGGCVAVFMRWDWKKVGPISMYFHFIITPLRSTTVKGFFKRPT